jgi:hypothetical protein
VGPTIQATGGTAPAIINSNTASTLPALAAGSAVVVVGADNASVGMEFIAVAGTTTGNTGAGGFTAGRMNGTETSPTTLNANDRILSANIRGQGGTLFATAVSMWNVFAGSTWTTANHETYHTWATIANGATAATERARLLSSGQIVVGATAAIGSEKLRISGQALADFMMVTPSAGLTAHAGGTQAAALALTAGVNYITTCATAGDSVRLPTSVAGLTVEVVNAGAASSQVYGASTDTINNVATATGVPVAAGKTGYYRCTVAGKWFGGVLT